MRQGLASLGVISVLLFGDISSAMNVNGSGDSERASGQRAAKTAISESDYNDWFKSAENGDIDRMKSLMRKGIDVNRKDELHRTALAIAAGEGHADVVDLFLFTTEKIVGLLNMYRNKQGIGDDDLKRHLFDAFDYGDTLTGAAYNGRTKVVELLLDRGVIDIAALTGAAWGGRTEVVELLLNRGVDVNSQDKQGETALGWAAENGRTEVVELLLDRGADINFRDDDGKTAIIWAAWYRNLEMIELLLDRGAYINSQDSDGKTALMEAVNGEGTEVIRILLTVDFEDEQSETTLKKAVQGKRAEVVKLLLDRGANPDTQDSKGKTAMDYAREEDNSKAISLLEEAQRKKRRKK